MARLLSRQKPWLPFGSFLLATTPRGPAWCPGGRTAQKALAASPATTASTATQTAAAARSATWKDAWLMAVSGSRCAMAQGLSGMPWHASCTREGQAAEGCLVGCMHACMHDG